MSAIPTTRWAVPVVAVLGLLLAACSATAGPAPATSATSDVAPAELATPEPNQTDDSKTGRRPHKANPPTTVNPPKVGDTIAPLLYRIKTKDKVVFFTIDDGGIEEEDTVRVLRNKDIPVTAFLTTKFIDQPEFYTRIADNDGQTIQNHTVDHYSMPGRSDQQDQFCRAQTQLKEWYGEKPWIARPPYGEFDYETQRAARACGIQYLVHWTINMPEGGKGRFQYREAPRLRPGDIILAHWRPGLGADLRNALKEIRRQGFQVGALQDYLPKVK